MREKISIIRRTRDWIHDFVIEHEMCPFAKREFEKDSIFYEVVENDSLQNQLRILVSLCQQMAKDNSIETAFVIYPHGLNDFDTFLDFLELSNRLLHDEGYEGTYQLASFHPDYCFNGVDKADPSNYSNRSPFPMLHILRESSLALALKYYKNPETIPERNVENLRAIGVETLEKILKNSY